MTVTTASLDSVSLTGLVLLLLLVFGLAVEIGYRAHRLFGRADSAADGNASDESLVLSTALLLLALLLGFTFSMALARFDARRAEVIREANDIGTAWLRAGLVAGPAGKALQDRLASYAETRIAENDGRYDAAAAEEQRRIKRAKGAALRHEIWALTAAAIAPEPATAQAASLVASVNAVIDTATTREAAIDARVPVQVIMLLIVYSTMSAFLLGYVLGAYGSHHRVATAVLFLLLSLTIVLIIDLDRPKHGAIRVSQTPMIDLVAEIRPPAAAPK